MTTIDPEELNEEDPGVAAAPEDIAGLEQALEAEKQKAAEYLASWQRAQADFINYKRRTEQERLEFNSYANANLLCGILPVLDDFERALQAVPEEYKNDDWVEGVRLVEKKFKTILEGLGVKQIRCLGQPFDPSLHEAIRQEKGKEGMVVEEILKGYTLNDKLLRASRVAVGTGEGHIKKTHAKEESEETKEAEDNG
jgi:molecular chaperone GrpE